MNTSPFTKSANYYDVIYRNKNYSLETKRIHQLIQSADAPSLNMVDLGCGTGTHAIFFSRLGYSVTGVDLSKSMLKMAKKNVSLEKRGVFFKNADIVKFSSPNTFGVAVSLFHVLSYLLTRQEVMNFFNHTYRNLVNDGVFIFECWYGPGVLIDPPRSQTKTVVGEGYVLKRKKAPFINTHNHTVRVIHNITITRGVQKPVRYSEAHTLRYFFYPEIKQMLNKAGFSLIQWGQLKNTLSNPSPKTWSVLFVAKKASSPITRVREK